MLVLVAALLKPVNVSFKSYDSLAKVGVYVFVYSDEFTIGPSALNL